MKKLIILLSLICLIACEKEELQEVDNSDLIQIIYEKDSHNWFTCYKYKWSAYPEHQKEELLQVFTCFDTTNMNYNGYDPKLLKVGIYVQACQECFKND